MDFPDLGSDHLYCILRRTMYSFRPLILACVCLVLIFNQLSGAHVHLVHEEEKHVPAGLLTELSDHGHEHRAAHVVAANDEHHELGQNAHGQFDLDAPQASGSNAPKLPLLALITAILLLWPWRRTAPSLTFWRPPPRPWQPRLLIPPSQAPPHAL